MHRRYRLIALAAALVTIAAAFVWPWPWLLVRQNDTLQFVFPGGEGTRFALRWMHSVEKEDWIEEFELEHGAIDIVATRFKTFGAGVPAHAGKQTTLEKGWVVMRGIDRVVDPLAVQAADAEHYRLRYHGRWYDLSAPGTKPILTFANAREPLYRVLPTLIAGWLG